MRNLTDDHGIAHPAALLFIIVVLAGVGFAGYRVYKSSKDKAPAIKTSGQAPNQATAEVGTEKSSSKAWANGDWAVKGTYADADIVQLSSSKWRLYYAVQPEVLNNKFEVYSATSSNGKTWNQESGTRKTMATFPDVVKTKDGKWRMYFQQAGVIKSAISTNGLSFTDESGTRIDKTNSVGLTLDNVAAPTTYLQSNGTYLMVYRGTINKRYASDTPNPTTQLLLWATSKDGLAWSKQGIAVDTRNDTLRGQLDGPDLVKWDDGKLHMFATTYAGVYEFAFDGKKFSEGAKAFALGTSTPAQNGQPARDVAPPGDPTLAKIGGRWYMYYGLAGISGGIKYATYGDVD